MERERESKKEERETGEVAGGRGAGSQEFHSGRGMTEAPHPRCKCRMQRPGLVGTLAPKLFVCLSGSNNLNRHKAQPVKLSFSFSLLQDDPLFFSFFFR